MNTYNGVPMFYGASPKIFEFAKKMRYSPTETEKTLWGILNAEPFIIYKFRRQHPIAKFIADFYSHKMRLVIEIDGGYHLQKEQKEYDTFRDEDMKEFGISVIRCTNEQVIQNIAFVITKINEALLLQKGRQGGSSFK